MSEDDKLEAAKEALKKSHKRMDTPRSPEKHKPLDPKQAADLITNLGIFGKIAGTANHIWNGFLRPVTRFLNPLFGWITALYKFLFRRFAYEKGKDGLRVYSEKKAGGTILGLAVFTLIMPYLLFQFILPGIFTTAYDGTMLLFKKEDRIFLSRAELIDPERGMYQVSGCRDIRGCDGGDNTTYFRLRDNVILDIQYWTTRAEPYDPAEIAGAMVSELNDCTISYYGRRVKALRWYPYIIKASCRPVGPSVD